MTRWCDFVRNRFVNQKPERQNRSNSHFCLIPAGCPKNQSRLNEMHTCSRLSTAACRVDRPESAHVCAPVERDVERVGPLLPAVRLRVRRARREGDPGERNLRRRVRGPRPQQPGAAGHQGNPRERQQVRLSHALVSSSLKQTVSSFSFLFLNLTPRLTHWKKKKFGGGRKVEKGFRTPRAFAMVCIASRICSRAVHIFSVVTSIYPHAAVDDSTRRRPLEPNQSATTTGIICLMGKINNRYNYFHCLCATDAFKSFEMPKKKKKLSAKYL